MQSNLQREWRLYLEGKSYKAKRNLYQTVEVNENFYIGKQWEGVTSNGLPTPVFNFMKRVVNYLVASIASDSVRLHAEPIGLTSERDCEYVNAAFTEIIEDVDLSGLLRKSLKNAAVDGDACIYMYWDPEVETGEVQSGGIRAEIVDNTRVIFGNETERRVQYQPYVMIESEEYNSEVYRKAEKFNRDNLPKLNSPEGKQTVVLKLWKEDGRVLATEFCAGTIIRPTWETGLTRYPLTWISWDEVRDSYHGQALVTGLIPNQVFVNKLFAMAKVSLMTTAYPKILYDKTRLDKWDSRVGSAIGVNGGDMSSVARIIDPAAISPQISQFINLAISYTQNFMGATDAALGNVNPTNTSAIIALQRASQVPTELVKLDLNRFTEDFGRNALDFCRAYYGRRKIRLEKGKAEYYNFENLGSAAMKIKLEVGAGNYWSEIATVQTLDNLLSRGAINFAEYLERIPDGYIKGKADLLKSRTEKFESSGEAVANGAGVSR
ncbi:MAG: hypothetical protein LBM98_10820 [Oscillospiraceae bacterium]|jgi:hypothetical protein|nr:hypothetical protein [Oscillospiraceae bacterium]